MDEEDNGTAEWAAEQAVMLIAKAWYRRTVNEKRNGGKLMLDIIASARSHITPKQWREIAK